MIVSGFAVFLAALSLPHDAVAAGDMPPMGSDPPRVVFEIAQGDQVWGNITLELNEEKAPITTKNFLRYVDEGYYDGTLIHRVLVAEGARIQIFQGGGYTELGKPNKPGQHEPIKLETRNGLTNERGTIAMARDSSPDTATSEFFVNVEANHKLDYQSEEKQGYAVFGKIVDGWDVVAKISKVEVVTNPDPELKGEKSQPVKPPMVRKAQRVPQIAKPAEGGQKRPRQQG